MRGFRSDVDPGGLLAAGRATLAAMALAGLAAWLLAQGSAGDPSPPRPGKVKASSGTRSIIPDHPRDASRPRDELGVTGAIGPGPGQPRARASSAALSVDATVSRSFPMADPPVAFVSDPESDAPLSDQALAGRETLHLEITLNGRKLSTIAEIFKLPSGRFAARASELRAIGLAPPGKLADDDILPLGKLPGLRYAYDEPGQTLALDVPLELLAPYRGNGSTAERVDARSDYGMIVNYSALAVASSDYATWWPNNAGVNLGLEIRAFSPYGAFTQTGIIGQTLVQSSVSRLDTTYSYTSADWAATGRVGDMITSGPLWARPIRLFGLQAERDYGPRPDIVTTALPTLVGTAQVPTTLDVFVNGSKTYSQDLPVGPYDLSNLGMAGAGNAEIRLRDISGREIRASLPYFVSTAMLRPGVVDFSAQVGYPRFLYGISDAAYGQSPVGTWAARFGALDNLTFQTYGEAGAGLVNLGAGASVNLFDRAIVTFAGQASRYSAAYGGLAYGSISTRIGPVSLTASSQRIFGSYRDLAAILSYPVETVGPFGLWNWDSVSAEWLTGAENFAVPVIDQVSAGVAIGSGGQASVSYAHQRQRGTDTSHFIGASYSQTIEGGLSFFASAFADVGDNRSLGVSFGLTWNFGDHVVSAGGLHSGVGKGATVAVGKQLSSEPGSMGYRGRLSAGTSDISGGGAVGYSGQYGVVTASGDLTPSGRSAQIEIDGAVAMIGSAVAFGQRSEDAFAIIRAGLPGVPILSELRPAGVTDFTGNILVADLPSFNKNRISVDTRALPTDIIVAKTEDVAVPARRSGVLIDIGAEKLPPSALVNFVDTSGQPLEPGAEGRVPNGKPFIVGYDGQAFVQGLGPHNEAQIRLVSGQRCGAQFAFDPNAKDSAAIGPVTCSPALANEEDPVAALSDANAPVKRPEAAASAGGYSSASEIPAPVAQ
jgi:outer membrane usher protein